MKTCALLILCLSFRMVAFTQTNHFIEYTPTFSFGYVGNSLHYNHANTNMPQGFNIGLGMAFKIKKSKNLYSYWGVSSNRRIYELNRLKPYADPTSTTLIRHEARGVEFLCGIIKKVSISPQIAFVFGGGLTQNIVSKQYEHIFQINGILQQNQTIGYGSASFRNRFFVRTGIELQILKNWSLGIEPSFSAEIKAPFVKTIDKVNPLTFGLHLRAIHTKP